MLLFISNAIRFIFPVIVPEYILFPVPCFSSCFTPWLYYTTGSMLACTQNSDNKKQFSAPQICCDLQCFKQPHSLFPELSSPAFMSRLVGFFFLLFFFCLGRYYWSGARVRGGASDEAHRRADSGSARSRPLYQRDRINGVIPIPHQEHCITPTKTPGSLTSCFPINVTAGGSAGAPRGRPQHRSASRGLFGSGDEANDHKRGSSQDERWRGGNRLANRLASSSCIVNPTPAHLIHISGIH